MGRGDMLSRQLELIQALQSYRFGVSTDELAERIRCSRRTIQRDLAALQGILTVHSELRDGKKVWMLDKDAMTGNRLELTLMETLSLFLSQQLLTPLAGTQFGDGLISAVQKIRAMLPPKALNYFDDLDETLLVKNPSYHDYSDQDQEIRLINDAVRSQSVLRLRYTPASADREVVSEFHPYGLVLLQESLYCVGYLVASEAIRLLKVARIVSVKRSSKGFKRPDDFSLEQFVKNSFGVFQSDELAKIKARFTGWAARSVRETSWHSSQKIVDDSKGVVTATFEVAGTVEFKRWTLSFGQYCRVLSPKSLITELRDELAAATKNYAGDS